MLTVNAIESAIREAKKAHKPLKRFDQAGLYLLATPGGSGLWRFKFQFQGREKLIGLGRFPEVTLKRAREKRDEARRQVADGVDPSAIRKAEKASQADSLEAICREWLKNQEGSVCAGTLRRDRRRLEAFVLPYLGKRPIKSITRQDLLTVLLRIQDRGLRETAHRTRSVVSRVFGYALALNKADHNVALDVMKALAPVIERNFPAITDPREIGKLLRAIHGYLGTPAVCAALKLAPLTFTRPGELRRCEWRELDLDAEHPEWRIPKEKMKMRKPHIVPLSRQAVEILRDLQLHTGGGKYVFPSARGGNRPMSENAVNLALRALGYEGDAHVGHGFRSTASTRLNELNYNSDVIELQLAHKPRGVRAKYDRSERLDDRRAMMQGWADHLDMLRDGSSNVVPIGLRKSA